MFWGLVFGPLTFPLALVCWHCVQVARGEQHFTQGDNVARWVQTSSWSSTFLLHIYVNLLPRSRVLNSMSVLTKSAVQVT